MPHTLHIAIIGGGAAGFFAAIEAKRNFLMQTSLSTRRIRKYLPKWKSPADSTSRLPGQQDM